MNRIGARRVCCTGGSCGGGRVRRTTQLVHEAVGKTDRVDTAQPRSGSMQFKPVFWALYVCIALNTLHSPITTDTLPIYYQQSLRNHSNYFFIWTCRAYNFALLISITALLSHLDKQHHQPRKQSHRRRRTATPAHAARGQRLARGSALPRCRWELSFSHRAAVSNQSRTAWGVPRVANTLREESKYDRTHPQRVGMSHRKPSPLPRPSWVTATAGNRSSCLAGFVQT